MKLLERERTADDGTPPEAAPEGTPADPGVRTCSNCGAELEPGQDWCLKCGAAAGALGERPGWRAAMTVLALTLVLVAGAVAAAFAALSDDPTRTVVASTPPAPAAVPPAATTPGDGTPTTPEGGDGETGTLPEVDPPSSTSDSSPGRVTPTPTSSTPAPTPTPTPTPTPSPSDGGSSTSPGSTGSGSGTNTTTTPPTPAAEQIDVEDDQVSVYDPYGRAQAAGAPAKAIDGDRSTSWYIDAAPASTQIGMGYLVNVGEARGIRRIELRTPTPGFSVEVYATDEATAPPNILDSRWAHIRDKTEIGVDRDKQPEKIVLGAGSSKYRNVLLWITKPPATGTRVRIAELQLFG